MDNIRNMFTLGGGGRTGEGGASPIPRRSNTNNYEQSWERLAGGDDMSAPNVARQFGRQGGRGNLTHEKGGKTYSHWGWEIQLRHHWQKSPNHGVKHVKGQQGTHRGPQGP
jgi:hypothetical protein